VGLQTQHNSSPVAASNRGVRTEGKYALNVIQAPFCLNPLTP